ncbi:hypothetical protein LCGC14_1519740 [marine sediment metagenome]|uniref:Uncharacterized protein n=1 Tax=marine sediment metagenome TaxID=412755 RepID=A0A0F9IZ05_9ZZZZ
MLIAVFPNRFKYIKEVNYSINYLQINFYYEGDNNMKTLI